MQNMFGYYTKLEGIAEGDLILVVNYNCSKSEMRLIDGKG